MFDVGDLVVCVDAAGQRAIQKLVAGKHYRIADVFPGNGCLAVEVEGYDPSPCLGSRADRFRKIDATDTEVSRLIRACKPVREGQPA